MSNKAAITVSYDRDITPEAKRNSYARFANAESIVNEVKNKITLDGDAFLEHYITVTDSVMISVRAVKKHRKANVLVTNAEALEAIEKAKNIILERVSDKKPYAY